MTLTSPSAPLGTVLASSFFVLLMALTAFSFVLAHGPGWFLPTLACQSVLLAATGERTPVVTDAIVLIVLLCHAGVRPPARQVQVAICLTIAAVLAVTGARAAEGRAFYQQDTGISARAGALAKGVAGAAGQPLLVEAATRLDAVDFGGAVLQFESFGQPRLSASDVPGSLPLAVPSKLWPSKLTHAGVLNPVQTEDNDFGLQQVNFLPGFAGLYLGFLSPAQLIVFLAFLGFLAALGERWLFRRPTAARTAFLAGALITALSYEQGLPAMLVGLRTAAAVAVAVKLVELASVRQQLRLVARRPGGKVLDQPS